MATLAEEIAKDIYSPELEADLFEPVLWDAKPLQAMVTVSGVEESFDDPGGPVLSAQRDFKFRRKDLEGIASDLSMLGKVITHNSRTYDIDEIDERGDTDFPLIVVTATLRK